MKKKRKLQQRNDKALADRLSDVEGWLTKRKERVAEAKAERREALLPYEERVDNDRNMLHARQGDAALMGSAVDAAEQRIEELKVALYHAQQNLQLREEQHAEASAAATEASDVLHKSVCELRRQKRMWSRILRTKFGSGDFRRKRRQRQKLERRLAKKEERAAKAVPITAEEIAMGVLPEEKRQMLEEKEG
jgi:hypothetical protein